LCDRVGILRDGIITEISRHRQDTATTWCIDTNYDESIKKIIEAEGGTSISYNKGWYFAIGDAATAIPEIVRQLAAAECPVREVRRHEQGFGSAIRTLYAGSKTEETS